MKHQGLNIAAEYTDLLIYFTGWDITISLLHILYKCMIIVSQDNPTHPLMHLQSLG